MTTSAALPAYEPAAHIPPPLDLPSLRLVQEAGGTYRAHLSMALAQRLGLKANQPIDLHPPGSAHPWWHLDLRPQAANRVRWYADTRPRIHTLTLPATALGDSATLTLRLVPGDPAFPGYYPLLPDAYFAPR